MSKETLSKKKKKKEEFREKIYTKKNWGSINCYSCFSLFRDKNCFKS